MQVHEFNNLVNKHVLYLDCCITMIFCLKIGNFVYKGARSCDVPVEVAYNHCIYAICQMLALGVEVHKCVLKGHERTSWLPGAQFIYVRSLAHFAYCLFSLYIICFVLQPPSHS